MNNVTIKCLNDGREYEIAPGMTLSSLAKNIGGVVKDPKTGVEYPILAAFVDHKLKELS